VRRTGAQFATANWVTGGRIPSNEVLDIHAMLYPYPLTGVVLTNRVQRLAKRSRIGDIYSPAEGSDVYATGPKGCRLVR
jgi:hypothetical protein